MKKTFRFCIVSVLMAWGATDGFSVASAQDFAEELEFASRQQQLYQVKFVARPDAKRFQLMRLPSAKWPKRETFFVEVGETTADGQIRVAAFEERKAKNENGIIVDASQLKVIHLKEGKEHTLVRNIECHIPTYFAELKDTSDPGKKFYVKEGDEFELKKHPATTFRLKKVNEDSAVISASKGGKEVSEFEISKN